MQMLKFLNTDSPPLTVRLHPEKPTASCVSTYGRALFVSSGDFVAAGELHLYPLPGITREDKAVFLAQENSQSQSLEFEVPFQVIACCCPPS